jgi:hypothetical protein
MLIGGSFFESARTGVRVSLEELAQALLVKIAHWRLTVWTNPLRMLLSQVVVDLLLKLGQRVN